MGRRGRLKIAWLRAVQVRVLPRAWPSFGRLARLWRAGAGGLRAGRLKHGSPVVGGLWGPGALLGFEVDGVGEGADFVCLQQFVEGVAVEQGGSHVPERRQLQL